jgi:hypothetical protein
MGFMVVSDDCDTCKRLTLDILKMFLELGN